MVGAKVPGSGFHLGTYHGPPRYRPWPTSVHTMAHLGTYHGPPRYIPWPTPVHTMACQTLHVYRHELQSTQTGPPNSFFFELFIQVYVDIWFSEPQSVSLAYMQHTFYIFIHCSVTSRFWVKGQGSRVKGLVYSHIIPSLIPPKSNHQMIRATGT